MSGLFSPSKTFGLIGRKILNTMLPRNRATSNKPKRERYYKKPVTPPTTSSKPIPWTKIGPIIIVGFVILYLLIIFISFRSTEPVIGQESTSIASNIARIKLLQFNIRASDDAFIKTKEEHLWKRRESFIQQLVTKHSPFTILGLSEGHIPSMESIRSVLPNNYHIHECSTRKQGWYGDENVDWNLYNALIWNSNDLRLITKGSFQISDTPQTINTKIMGGNNNTGNYRCAAWAYFRFNNRPKDKLLFISTQLDTISDLKTRLEQFILLERFAFDFMTNNGIDIYDIDTMPYVLIAADWNDFEYSSNWYNYIYAKDDGITYKWMDLSHKCRVNAANERKINNEGFKKFKMSQLYQNSMELYLQKEKCDLVKDSLCTAAGYDTCINDKAKNVKGKSIVEEDYLYYYFDWPWMIWNPRCEVVAMEIDDSLPLASDHFPVITDIKCK